MSILSFNQLKALIESFRDDDDIEIETIAIFFRRLIREIVTPFLDISYPFVVRSSANDDGEVFPNISRCSYNPKIKSICLRRCNYKEQQVFYGAIPASMLNIDAGTTALLETSMDYVKDISIKSKHFTLSRWQLKRPLKVFVLPFSEQSAKTNRDFEEMNRIFDKFLSETFLDKDVCRFYRNFLEYISEIFPALRNMPQALRNFQFRSYIIPPVAVNI
jgi:hypothetical protein